MRCDEGRPICANSISARRICEYRKSNVSDQDVASRLPPLTNLGLSPGAGVANLNMHHLELLVHFSFAIYVPELEEDHDATSRDLEFDQFLDRFIQGVRVHRGTRAVTSEYEWELLLSSKIGSLITKGIDPLGFHNPISLRQHFESLLSHSTRLDADGKLACDKALRMIEGALQDLESLERSTFGLRMIFVWPILLPEGFIGLLEQRVPEAIAILGRYAILLQAGRKLWQIKDAGQCLSNLVSEFLGPGWEMWLSGNVRDKRVGQTSERDR
ncbi:hypothetical protein CDV36_006049, partial [Fusarium kuroshium]